MTDHAIDSGWKWTAYRVIQKGIPLCQWVTNTTQSEQL